MYKIFFFDETKTFVSVFEIENVFRFSDKATFHFVKKINFFVVFVYSINTNISLVSKMSKSTHDWWKFISNIHSSTNLSTNISKQIISNDIIIYDDEFAYNRLFTTANFFSNIWRDSENIVNISKKNWMSISTMTNAKLNSSKIYFLKSQNRAIIDKKFDRLHVENKMNWITKFTSYDYFCFVIWKTIYFSNKSLKRKERVVINIQNFNKISMFDVYSMILQNDMIIFVMSSLYISLINAISFFHQWLVKIADCHKFIVVTHRDSEQ